jgi:hypothetical protein
MLLLLLLLLLQHRARIPLKPSYLQLLPHALQPGISRCRLERLKQRVTRCSRGGDAGAIRQAGGGGRATYAMLYILDSSIDLSYRTYHADREGYLRVLLEEQGEGHTVNAGDVVT